MQNIGYAVSFTCLLFALHLLRACTKPIRHRLPCVLLCSLFFVFAFQYGFLSLMLANGKIGLSAGFPGLMRPVLALLICPLMFLYFVAASDWDFKLRPIHTLHLIPALIIGAQMFSGVFIFNVDLAIIIVFSAYAVALLWRARRGPTQFELLGASKDKHYFALIGSAALLALSVCIEGFVIFDIASGRGLTGSLSLLINLCMDLCVIAIVLSAALQRPSPFDWLYTPAPQTPSQDDKANVTAFENLVQTERLYAQENLGLGTIAKRLNLSRRRLSESINRVYGESYSAHMNGLRVNAAKTLLSAHPEMAMIDIMYDAGFWSKSSFNKEFRARENMSPSDYQTQTHTQTQAQNTGTQKRPS